VPSVFNKLNLKDEREIVVLNAPASFDAELQSLRKVKVVRTLGAVERVTFALVFATQKSQVDRLSKSLGSKALGDAILWFAYPKGTAPQLKCDFNRDNGWGPAGR
jgi:hypothetical protein